MTAVVVELVMTVVVWAVVAVIRPDGFRFTRRFETLGMEVVGLVVLTLVVIRDGDDCRFIISRFETGRMGITGLVAVALARRGD